MSRIDEALKVLERAQYCAEHKCSECIYYDKCPDDLYDAEKETFIPIKYELCEDCVSREAMLNGLASIAKAKAKSDEQKALMGRVMFFTEQLPPVTPKQKWIPIKTRPLTDKEKEEYADLGYGEDSINFMYDCPLPDDGQEVLVTTRYDEVNTDTFYRDDGCYFETYCDEDDVKAWMPLPEPYKAESEDKR